MEARNGNVQCLQHAAHAVLVPGARDSVRARAGEGQLQNFQQRWNAHIGGVAVAKSLIAKVDHKINAVRSLQLLQVVQQRIVVVQIAHLVAAPGFQLRQC